MEIESKLLTIGQTAEMIGVSIQTLRRWDNSGKLHSVRKKKQETDTIREMVLMNL